MTRNLNERLGDDLDRLEVRGRMVLTAAGRRRALARAVGIALPAALPAPLLFLALRLMGRGRADIALAVSLLLPLFVLSAAYAWFRRSGPPDRRAALALFDRLPGYRDRVAATDEFLRMPERDGWRAAALHEAAPWIGSALTDPLARTAPGFAASVGRRGACVPAAAVILVVAMLLPQGGGRIFRGRNPAVAGSALSGAGRPTPDPTSPSALATDDPADTRRDAGSSTNGAGPGGVGGQEHGTAPAGAGGAAARMAAVAGPRSAQATNAASAATGLQDAAPIDATEAGASDGGSAESVPSGQRSDGLRAGRGDPPPAGSAGQRQASQGNGARREQSAGESRDQSGGQAGRRTGQGGNGANSGADEGLKKSRGAFGLLLAVPMVDRVRGTANRGPTASMARPGTPRALPAGTVAAQARGSVQGATGRIAHRPATSHETRLVGAYFARPGMPADGP